MNRAILMKYEENYLEKRDEGRLQILYGYGSKGKVFARRYGPFDYICDRNYSKITAEDNVKLIGLDNLEKLNVPMDILIAIMNPSVRINVKNELIKLDIDARIFDIYKNCAFDFFEPEENYKSNKKEEGSEIKRIHIINPDHTWILQKFAEELVNNLQNKEIEASIGSDYDTNADINHFMHYGLVDICEPINSTFMITHVNCSNSINKIKHALKYSKMGICMSRETMEFLEKNGVPREKICYINPAQDGLISPKKIVLGITHRCYDDYDHRKRASAIIDIMQDLDPKYFKLVIMGSGWESIIHRLNEMGFETEYYSSFIKEIYNTIVPSFDYYLYWGFDEGSMGYLDALAAGIKTIVTPQGYHLDTVCPITYPCRTISDFKAVLKKIENEKKVIVESVANWTWDNYTKKHLDIWNYIIGNDGDWYAEQHKYEDGIFSVLPYEVRI